MRPLTTYLLLYIQKYLLKTSLPSKNLNNIFINIDIYHMVYKQKDNADCLYCYMLRVLYMCLLLYCSTSSVALKQGF